MFRLAVDTPVSLALPGFQNGYPAGSFLWIVNNIYFQYYSLLIFLICAVTMVVVSYATPPPSEQSLTGLTYATVTREQKRETRRSWNQWDVANSVVVLALILTAYLYFIG
jgi:solute:Na+ symporter, SSS family